MPEIVTANNTNIDDFNCSRDSNILKVTSNSLMFVLDLTSSLRFEARRETIRHSVILPIIQ